MFNVSKNQIVVVTEPHTFVTYEAPSYTFVWLEDFKKHCDQPDVVKSADQAGDSHTADLGRTKYKVYRNERDANGRNQKVLTSDNAHVAVEQEHCDIAFYWDKPTIKKVVEKVVEKMRWDASKQYDNTREFINTLLTKKDIPKKSVLVRLENTPGRCETNSFLAYVPVEGYYISSPVWKDSPYRNEGYNLLFTINNVKTESTPTFVMKHKMSGGVFNNGGVEWKIEGNDTPFYLHNIMYHMLPSTTRYQLASCREEVKTRTWRYAHEHGEEENQVKVLRVDDVLLSDLALHPDRKAFKEQLVMKVFHPDRVARLVGDNWGTEESWLNQV